MKTSDSFDTDIRKLGELAFDVNSLDEFTDLYQRILEENYNQMVMVKNTEKLLSGLYTERAKALKAILHEQIRFLGAEPPRPRIDA